MKLFDLYATLGLDAKAFNQGISAAKSTFGSFSSSISTGIGGVGKGISGALRTVANGATQLTNTVQSAVKGTLTAFTGLTSMLTVTGIKYNSMMENYTMDFTTLLQDAEKAATKVEELRKLDLSTPLDFETLASATKMMLNFGITEEEAGNKLLQLSDIAMGNKEKFDSLTLAFSQIRSVGKLTMLDLRQMANQGFNPLQIVAEETGVAIGDLQEFMSYGKPSEDMTKAIKQADQEVKKLGDNASLGAQMLAQMGEEGQISADIVAQAIDIATGEGGRFYKATENAAKTLTGQWSMLQGGVKKLIGSGFEPLSKSLTEDILPNLNEFVDDLDTAYNTRGGGNSGLVGMLEVARDELYKIRDSSDDIGENLARSIRQGMHTGALGIKTINGILPDLMDIGREAFTAFRTGFKDNVTQLSNSAEIIAPDLLANAIGLKGDFLVAGLDIVGGIARGISADFAEGGEGRVKSAINGLFSDVNAWFANEENMTALGDAAKGILGGIADGIVTYGPEILGNALGDSVRIIFGEEAGNAAEETGKLVLKTVGAGVSAIGNKFGIVSDDAMLRSQQSVWEAVQGETATDKINTMTRLAMSASGKRIVSYSEAANVIGNVTEMMEEYKEAAEEYGTALEELNQHVNEMQYVSDEYESEFLAAIAKVDELGSALDDVDGKTVTAYVDIFGRTGGTFSTSSPNAHLGAGTGSEAERILGYDTGLDFVPYDNFLARLHKGEQVLTKAEAAQYRKGGKYGDVFAVETQSQQPIMVNLDGDALVAAITRKMTRSIGNRNLQQLLAMGG